MKKRYLPLLEVVDGHFSGLKDTEEHVLSKNVLEFVNLLQNLLEENNKI